MRILLFLLAALLAAGCGHTGPSFSDTVIHPAPSQDAFIPASYTLGPGDVVEVLYHSNPRQMVTRYVIGLGDTLRIEFYKHPDMNRDVAVRPDGFISLPLVGEVQAYGKTPSDLRQALTKAYSEYLRRPDITVIVADFDAKLDELKEAVTNAARGQARLVTLRPDGAITLPYIGDVQAAGLTMPQLNAEVEEKYQTLVGGGLGITIDLNDAQSNVVYVMGEVNRPGFYQLRGPTTVTQAVAMAGGFADSAYTDEVVLVTRGAQRQPMGRIIDMDDIIGTGNIDRDVMLKQYDIVFVPMSPMAKAGLFGRRLWELIPARFSGTVGYQFFSNLTPTN